MQKIILTIFPDKTKYQDFLIKHVCNTSEIGTPLRGDGKQRVYHRILDMPRLLNESGMISKERQIFLKQPHACIEYVYLLEPRPGEDIFRNIHPPIAYLRFIHSEDSIQNASLHVQLGPNNEDFFGELRSLQSDPVRMGEVVPNALFRELFQAYLAENPDYRAYFTPLRDRVKAWESEEEFQFLRAAIQRDGYHPLPMGYSLQFAPSFLNTNYNPFFEPSYVRSTAADYTGSFSSRQVFQHKVDTSVLLPQWIFGAGSDSE